MPVPATKLVWSPDDRFLASHAEFDAWAEGRKELRMEFFYRELRQRHGVLMDGDPPAGVREQAPHRRQTPVAAPDERDLVGAPNAAREVEDAVLPG